MDKKIAICEHCGVDITCPNCEKFVLKKYNKTSVSKHKFQIIESLHHIDDIVCHYLHEEQNLLRNRVCRELRKIHTRLDKLTKEYSDWQLAELIKSGKIEEVKKTTKNKTK